MKEDKYIYLKLKLLECKDAIESLGRALTNIETELIKLKTEITPEEQATRFEPKNDDEYVFINGDGNVRKVTYTSDFDSLAVNFNNCFRISSEESVKRFANNVIKVQNRLMQLHEELCPEFFGLWESAVEPKYAVYLYHDKWKWCSNYEMNYCTVVFSKEAAEKACEILNAEKFMLEENNAN